MFFRDFAKLGSVSTIRSPLLSRLSSAAIAAIASREWPRENDQGHSVQISPIFFPLIQGVQTNHAPSGKSP